MKKNFSVWLMARLKKLSLCSWVLVGATIFVLVYPNDNAENYNKIAQPLLVLSFMFFLMCSLWEDFRNKQKTLS